MALFSKDKKDPKKTMSPAEYASRQRILDDTRLSPEGLMATGGANRRAAQQAHNIGMMNALNNAVGPGAIGAADGSSWRDSTAIGQDSIGGYSIASNPQNQFGAEAIPEPHRTPRVLPKGTDMTEEAMYKMLGETRDWLFSKGFLINSNPTYLAEGNQMQFQHWEIIIDDHSRRNKVAPRMSFIAKTEFEATEEARYVCESLHARRQMMAEVKKEKAKKRGVDSAQAQPSTMK